MFFGAISAAQKSAEKHQVFSTYKQIFVDFCLKERRCAIIRIRIHFIDFNLKKL